MEHRRFIQANHGNPRSFNVPSVVERTPQLMKVPTPDGSSITTAVHATIFDPSTKNKPLKSIVEWAKPGKKRGRGRPKRSEVLANMVLAPPAATEAKARLKWQPKKRRASKGRKQLSVATQHNNEEKGHQHPANKPVQQMVASDQPNSCFQPTASVCQSYVFHPQSQSYVATGVPVRLNGVLYSVVGTGYPATNANVQTGVPTIVQPLGVSSTMNRVVNGVMGNLVPPRGSCEPVRSPTASQPVRSPMAPQPARSPMALKDVTSVTGQQQPTHSTHQVHSPMAQVSSFEPYAYLPEKVSGNSNAQKTSDAIASSQMDSQASGATGGAGSASAAQWNLGNCNEDLGNNVEPVDEVLSSWSTHNYGDEDRSTISHFDHSASFEKEQVSMSSTQLSSAIPQKKRGTKPGTRKATAGHGSSEAQIHERQYKTAEVLPRKARRQTKQKHSKKPLRKSIQSARNSLVSVTTKAKPNKSNSPTSQLESQNTSRAQQTEQRPLLMTSDGKPSPKSLPGSNNVTDNNCSSKISLSAQKTPQVLSSLPKHREDDDKNNTTSMSKRAPIPETSGEAVNPTTENNDNETSPLESSKTCSRQLVAESVAESIREAPPSQTHDLAKTNLEESEKEASLEDPEKLDTLGEPGNVRKSRRRKTPTKWYNPVSGSTMVKLDVAGIREGMVLQSILDIDHVEEASENQKLVGDFDPTSYVDPSLELATEADAVTGNRGKSAKEGKAEVRSKLPQIHKGAAIRFKWRLFELPESTIAALKTQHKGRSESRKARGGTQNTTRERRKALSDLVRDHLKTVVPNNPPNDKVGKRKEGSDLVSAHDPSASDEDEEQECALRSKNSVCDPLKLPDFYIALVQQAGKHKEHFYYLSHTSVEHTESVQVTHAGSLLSRERMGLFEWKVPLWVAAGTYTVEVGSSKGKFVAPSTPFQIVETVGEVDDMDIGVWCMCGSTQATVKYSGEWYCCDTCNSWQHADCCAPARPRPGKGGKGGKDKGPEEDELLQREKELYRDFNGKGDQTFTCWFCVPVEAMPDSQFAAPHLKTALRTSRVMRTINMITAASGGYSRRNDAETKICITPANVSHFLKSLLNAQEQQNPSRCIDLGCGTGALTRALPKGAYCIEKHLHRYLFGVENDRYHTWMHGDALDPSFFESRYDSFDLVISNPDFEVALQFLYIGLQLLRRSDRKRKASSNETNGLDQETNMWNSDFDFSAQTVHQEPASQEMEDASMEFPSTEDDAARHEEDDDPNSGPRLIFLLPSDFFEASILRARLYKLLDFRIVEEYKLGHLSYYADGSQKQTVDSLFVLKPGRKGKYQHKIINARLGGML